MKLPSFFNSLGFWTKFWAIYFLVFLVTLVAFDYTAVIKGHHDKLGDQFTFTHWLVTRLGISVIGAFIGYLIAHFLIVHKRG